MDRLLPSDAKENYLKSQPLGRLGSVRDIADATVYLFSSTGSYVSGQVLVGMSFPLPLQKDRADYPSGRRELENGLRLVWCPEIPRFPPFRRRSSQREGRQVEALIDGIVD